MVAMPMCQREREGDCINGQAAAEGAQRVLTLPVMRRYRVTLFRISETGMRNRRRSWAEPWLGDLIVLKFVNRCAIVDHYDSSVLMRKSELMNAPVEVILIGEISAMT